MAEVKNINGYDLKDYQLDTLQVSANEGKFVKIASNGLAADVVDLSSKQDKLTSENAGDNVTITEVSGQATKINALSGLTATVAELNYTDGVTSNIQTQLDARITGDNSEVSPAATINADTLGGQLPSYYTVTPNPTATATATLNKATIQGTTYNLGGSGPETYIKSAAADGDTLTLTKQDDTTVVYTPTIPTKISDLTDDTATNPVDKADTLTNLTATVTELNYTDGVTSNIQTQLDNKVTKNNAITAATKAKITYDTKGLVTAGADLAASDIPNLDASKITSGTFADARIASASTWNNKSTVSISDTGTATDEIQYITVNGVEKKISGGGGTWGSITGTLSNQTDLQTALDAKQAYLTSTNAGQNIVIAESSGLPRTYTRLEYLRGTGTQYIRTDVLFSSTLKIEARMSFEDLGQVGTYGTNNARLLFGRQSATWYIAMGSTAINAGTGDTNIHNFVLDCVNKTVTFDGTSFGDYSGTGYASVDDQYIPILGSGTYYAYSWRYYGRASTIYAFKIYNNGTLIRDYIPAKRNSDGVLGLYDVVNNNFLTNSGSDTFTAGAEIASYPLITASVITLQYTTTTPTEANTDGLKIAFLSAEPATRYDGWLYLIAEET